MKNTAYLFVNLTIAVLGLAWVWIPPSVYRTVPSPIPSSPAVELHPELPPAELDSPPKVARKFLQMNFELLRRDRSFYVFDAKKTDDGFAWTWKDDGRKTTVRFEGLDEKRLTKCVVSVAGADPNQPTVDMVFAASFIGQLFTDKKAERSVLKFWYTDPLLPTSAKIEGCSFAFDVDAGVSSITATPE